MTKATSHGKIRGGRRTYGHNEIDNNVITPVHFDLVLQHSSLLTTLNFWRFTFKVLLQANHKGRKARRYKFTRLHLFLKAQVVGIMDVLY